MEGDTWKEQENSIPHLADPYQTGLNPETKKTWI